MMISLHTADLEVIFWQLDVTAAFVSAKVVRKIVVTLPRGYGLPGSQPDDVYDLRKQLYGAKDSAKVYYDDYVKFHLSIGFKAIKEDRCFLQLRKGASFIKFCLHVDDSIIAQRGKELWDWYLKTLRSRYQFRVGPLKYFLGMRFSRDMTTGAMTIDQVAQIEKMLRVFGLDGKTARASTPVPTDKLRPSAKDIPTAADEIAKQKRFPYPQAIGHLNFLQQTSHPEISYPLKVCSKFVKEWGEPQKRWVKHIMLFLKSKRTSKFIIRGGKPTSRVLHVLRC
jgi:hypothetical protein